MTPSTDTESDTRGDAGKKKRGKKMFWHVVATPKKTKVEYKKSTYKVEAEEFAESLMETHNVQIFHGREAHLVPKTKHKLEVGSDA